jgi:WD40 repeat protein
LWRIRFRLQPIEEQRRLGARERRVMGSSRFPVVDLRLLGAIAVAVISLAALLSPEPVRQLTRSRVARGVLGSQIMSFALSPTTAQIATTSAAGRIALRAPETGWRIEQFLDFPGFAKAVAYSADGRILAAGGNLPGIHLWDLKSHTSKATRTLAVPIRRVNRVIFSPDGKTLAVTTDLDGTIVLWDLATHQERVVLHHPSPVVSAAFSPDGRWLATSGRDDLSIILWDLQSGARRTLLERGTGPTMALAFSPDGALLATAGFVEHHFRVWDLATQQVCRVFAGHSRPVNSVAFSPDGSLLASAGNDGMVGLWSVATGQRRVTLDSQSLWLKTVAFTPDGRTVVLATGSDDDVRSWDVTELLRASPAPDSSSINTRRVQRWPSF